MLDIGSDVTTWLDSGILGVAKLGLCGGPFITSQGSKPVHGESTYPPLQCLNRNMQADNLGNTMEHLKPPFHIPECSDIGSESAGSRFTPTTVGILGCCKVGFMRCSLSRNSFDQAIYFPEHFEPRYPPHQWPAPTQLSGMTA